jgi:hypothetical protein
MSRWSTSRQKDNQSRRWQQDGLLGIQAQRFDTLSINHVVLQRTEHSDGADDVSSLHSHKSFLRMACSHAAGGSRFQQSQQSPHAATPPAVFIISLLDLDLEAEDTVTVRGLIQGNSARTHLSTLSLFNSDPSALPRPFSTRPYSYSGLG